MLSKLFSSKIISIGKSQGKQFYSSSVKRIYEPIFFFTQNNWKTQNISNFSTLKKSIVQGEKNQNFSTTTRNSTNEANKTVIQIKETKEWWNEKLFEKGTKEEVPIFFQTYKDGKFKKYASKFKELNGKQLLNMSKENLQKTELGNLVGEVLFNHIQAFKVPQLNWNGNGEDFLASLKLIAMRNGWKLKDDFSVATETTISPFPIDIPTGNSQFDPVEQFWTELSKHAKKRWKSGSIAGELRPTFAICAAPGTGKTWTLNLLAKMGRNVDSFKHFKSLGGLQFDENIRFIFVPIDFNSASNYTPIDLKDVTAAVCLRFMFYAFMAVAKVQRGQSEKQSQIFWLSFQKLLLPMWKAGGSLQRLVSFFKEILTNRYGSKDWQIVFSIDEIERINGTNKNNINAKKVLDLFADHMSLDANSWCITTALENTTLIEIQNYAERPVPLIQLQRPSKDAVRMVFNNIYRSGRINENTLNTLLSYSGFHFRTLQSIYDVVEHEKSEKISLEMVLHELKKDKKLKSSFPYMPEDLVKLALRSKFDDHYQPIRTWFNEPIQTPLYKTVPTKPLSSFISTGLLINNFHHLNQLTIIPQLSPLALYIWCNVLVDESTPSYFKSAVEIALDQLGAQEKSDTRVNTFELFHARWEVVQRILSPANWPSWIGQALLAQSKLLAKIQQPILLEILQQRSNKIHHVLSQTIEQPSITSGIPKIWNRMHIENLVANLDQGVNGKDLTKFVWITRNQPAFDMILFFKTANEHFAFLVDLKNYLFSSTDLQLSEVSTRTQFLTSFRNLCPNLEIADENIFCGILSMKTIPEDITLSLYHCHIITKGKDKGQKIDYNLDFVLGSNEMKLVYGPTLEPFNWLFGTRASVDGHSPSQANLDEAAIQSTPPRK